MIRINKILNVQLFDKTNLMNMFFYSIKSIIELTFKKLLILIAFHLLINPFFISQNTPNCFLFEISQLKLTNSNKGPIKNIPEELKCFRPFKKQLNELVNIRRNQFYYVDSILKDNNLPKSFGFLPLILSQIYHLKGFGH